MINLARDYALMVHKRKTCILFLEIAVPTLRLASFNAENFSLLLRDVNSRAELDALSEDDYQGMNPSIYNPNKERRKIAEIARLILQSNFDVVGLCEVGGLETLAAFAKLYLHDRYVPYLHEENSRRGIFVGALVRKGRFPGLVATAAPGAFSRNLLQLDLGPRGGDLRIFVVHLKSQIGPDRGLEQRIREVNLLTSLVRAEKCIVMGDFNGLVLRGEAQFEYEPFLALAVVDVLEAVGVPVEKRRTHYYFDPAPRFTQLDYIFCTRDLQVRRARVVEGEIPLNSRQRAYLPSDHLLIWATITVITRRKWLFFRFLQTILR